MRVPRAETFQTHPGRQRAVAAVAGLAIALAGCANEPVTPRSEALELMHEHLADPEDATAPGEIILRTESGYTISQVKDFIKTSIAAAGNGIAEHFTLPPRNRAVAACFVARVNNFLEAGEVESVATIFAQDTTDNNGYRAIHQLCMDRITNNGESVRNGIQLPVIDGMPSIG